jgi:hypothetical protein
MSSSKKQGGKENANLGVRRRKNERATTATSTTSSHKKENKEPAHESVESFLPA